jgi:PAS domain S-box-containing protein
MFLLLQKKITSQQTHHRRTISRSSTIHCFLTLFDLYTIDNGHYYFPACIENGTHVVKNYDLFYLFGGLLRTNRRVSAHELVITSRRSDHMELGRKKNAWDHALSTGSWIISMETRNDYDRPHIFSWPECAIILCDSDGLVSEWDSQAERYFGWSEPEAVGRFLVDLISPSFTDTSSSPELKESLRFPKYLPGGEQQEITVSHRNGTLFTAQIITRISRRNGTQIVIARDISSRKAYEGRTEDASSSHKVINDILRFTIDRQLVGKQLGHILDYLFSIKTLHLLPKAGIFLVDQKSEKLILKIHRGFSDRHQKKCSEVPFGVCHCGQAAQLGITQFSHCASTPVHACEQIDPHGHLCLPVIRDSLLIGIVCFYVVKGYIHSREEEELLKSICHILGGIIETEEMDLQLVNLVKDLRTSIVSLRNEKKFSDSIIQGLNHGLLVVDPDGNILKSNAVAGAILQPFALALEGQNLFNIIGIEAATRITGNCSSGDENELDLTTNNGEKKILSYTTVPRDDTKGKQIGQIISFTDISEIKYVRKEMEKMNRLSTVAEIAAAVAHEVRNPLAGIKIMAQSIEEQSVTKEEQSECSKRIVRQVDRLNELLTEFFSYARPVTPKPRPISIIDILSETRHLISSKLSNKHIIFRDNHEQNLPFVMADPNQIQQVFLNLFLNAIDAIQQGGIIEVTTSKIGASELSHYKRKYPGLLSWNQYISLRFSDNGAGMSPETAEKVFEPFFTTKTTGSGLGLSIVYRTLKENGAAIVVESTEGKGTTFTIFFRTPA